MEYSAFKRCVCDYSVKLDNNNPFLLSSVVFVNEKSENYKTIKWPNNMIYIDCAENENIQYSSKWKFNPKNINLILKIKLKYLR